MIKVKRIDHVAIAVPDRDRAAQDLASLFGLAAGAREHVAAQRTDVAFLFAEAAPGGTSEATSEATSETTSIEVCAPAARDGNDGLQRFLDKRGPGLHHVCFEVDDLPGALATLKAAGVRLIDETPRPGARGHMVAFIHPAATGGVLFELCQPRDEAST